MLLLNKEKITVANIDVFPDHADPLQFWYVNGNIRLVERDRKKVLSYLWYIDGPEDKYGTGYLNFEVSSFVDDRTLDNIRSELVRVHPELDRKKIRLSSVNYTKGRVNFSVLGPIAQNAAAVKGDDAAVIYQSKEQIVWQAGSPSLVGDNAAVASITFTKEGRLAAAIKAAIENQSNSIAVVYALEYTGLRPAVKFQVKGNFTKFLEDFKASVGLPLPLEEVVINIGIQQHFQASWQKSDMQIELIDYTGEPGEGLKWAQKIVFDYLLKNLFEVQIGPGEAWSPLSEKPEVESLLSKESEADGDSEKKTNDEKKADRAARQTGSIPAISININISNYTGIQRNEMDFVYSETRAKQIPVSPQALVLENLDNPSKHILPVNRAQMSFGTPYPVLVSSMATTDFNTLGLSSISVEGAYPARHRSSDQQHYNLRFAAGGGVTGQNPLPFQYDDSGSSEVEYSLNFLFNPNSDWEVDPPNTYEYKKEGKTSNGSVGALPGLFLDFWEIKVKPSSDFFWYETDQIVVTLKADSWKMPKTVYIPKGKTDVKTLKVRSEKLDGIPRLTYTVQLLKNSKEVYQYGPIEIPNETKPTIEVHDQFKSHIPATFYKKLKPGIDVAIVTAKYEEPGFTWSSDAVVFDVTTPSNISIVIPTFKEYKNNPDCTFKYTVQLSDGTELTKDGKGGITFITGS